MLRPELTALIDADEEGRSRVDAARREAERRLATAKSERVRRKSERAAEERARLNKELQKLSADAEAEAALRRARRAIWLRDRRAAGAARLDEAVAAFLRIVLEGAP